MASSNVPSSDGSDNMQITPTRDGLLVTGAGRPTMEYLNQIPRTVPPGKVLAHNRVRAIWLNQEQGRNGFRFWAGRAVGAVGAL